MITWFRRLIGRALPTTLAGTAATATGMLLVLTFFVALGFWSVRHPPLDVPKVAIILVLLVVLPIIVYVGIRYWNRIEESLFPDIDEAWRAGVEALRRTGMSLENAPLYLVLGGNGLEEAFAQSMQAAGVVFQVVRVPGTVGVEPALRWYANGTAIYLFCARVGALTSLARSWGDSSESRPISWVDTLPTKRGGAPIRQSHSAAVQHARLMTIEPDDIVAETPESSESTRPAAAPERNARRRSTTIHDQQDSQRLRYLCRLIKESRRPHCGINGAVMVLPFELTEVDGKELQAIIEAVQIDVSTIGQATWLRYPVSGLLVGMEHAKGFDEFIKALGTDRTDAPLGAGFDVRQSATSERLQRLSDRICDRFERFIYNLFARPESLWEPRDNRKLYGLLCWIRQQLKPRLNTILGRAFGRGDWSGVQPPRSEQVARASSFFSGCYLAATGRSAPQQAFIKGVLFDKLVREQSRVEWTDEALRRHQWFQIAVWVGWAVFAGLLLLLARLVWRWMNLGP